MQDAVVAALDRIPARFFLLDDSGSMISGDGMRVVDRGPNMNKSWAACSRWDELANMARFHIQLAAHAPTEFRFLNRLYPVRIGWGCSAEDDAAAQALLLGALNDLPTAGTPLCRHISEVVAQIRIMAPQLRAAGQKAAVIIVTDGQASDGEVRHVLAPLKDLPAQVTLRLCTNDPKVVEYWTSVDADLELELDVLDDLRGEAAEVHTHNPWLTYGEPLQRLRESGLGIKLLDALDEHPLTPDDLRRMVQLIYAPAQPLPHPQLELAAFKRATIATAVAPIWDPRDSVTRPWIDTSKLMLQQPTTAAETGKKTGGCCCWCF